MTEELKLDAESVRVARHAIYNLKQYRAGETTFPGEAVGILERFVECAERAVPPQVDRYGYSPAIEDAEGVPQAVAAVLRSKGSVATLQALYDLINGWGKIQRKYAARRAAAGAALSPRRTKCP